MYLKEVIQKSKRKDDRRYLQFVEFVRTDRGPRHKILVNIGRVDDKSGRERLDVLTELLLKVSQTIRLLDCESDIEGKSSKQCRCELIFRRLFEDIGIHDILAKAFDGIRTDFDVNDALFKLFLNRLSAPASKHVVTDWQHDEYQVKRYDLHQYDRAMDYLEDYRNTIEEALFTQMKSLSTSRKLEVSIALFETTLCLTCGGRLKITVAVLDSDSVQRFLTHQGLNARPPTRTPAKY